MDAIGLMAGGSASPMGRAPDIVTGLALKNGKSVSLQGAKVFIIVISSLSTYTRNAENIGVPVNPIIMGVPDVSITIGNQLLDTISFTELVVTTTISLGNARESLYGALLLYK